ncbi:MAG TPA: TonB family protein [Candidatus Polarisedimenticolaceae bacterium]|nr:TonB family protein [Candidatus Polarisedimenticolaceae bacterium]
MSNRILLVDDDSEAAERFRRAFAELGRELVSTSDADRVLDWFVDVPPRLVLLAEGSPDIPTAAISRRLKADPRAEGVPVVVLTTDLPRDREELSRRIRILECDLIVARDVGCERLVEMVGRLIGDDGHPDDSRAGDRADAVRDDDTQPTLGALAKQINRDSPSAESFRRALAEGAAIAAPAAAGDAGDRGSDIEAHLDTLFGGPRATATPPVRPPVAPTGGPPGSVPPKMPPRPTADAPPRAPVASPARTAAGAGGSVALAGPPPGLSSPSIRRTTIRQAPKAVEQLRQPRIRERQHQLETKRAGWIRPAAAGGGVILLVGTVGLGWWLLAGQDGEPPAERPNERLARASLPPPAVERTAHEATPTTAEADSLPLPGPRADREPAVTPSPAQPPQPPRAAAQASRQATAPAPAPAPARSPPVAEATSDRESTAVSAPPAPTARQVPAAPVVEPPTRTDGESESAGRPAASEPPTPPDAGATSVRPNEAQEPPVGPGDAAPTDSTEPPPVTRTPAVVVERIEPQYPPKALRGIESTEIVLRVQIDESGRISRVLVDRGIPGSPIEAAAVSTVLRWKFKPATENGVPTESWTIVRFAVEP